MPDLESLKFKIVADSSSATSKLNELSKSVENLEKVMGGASKGFGKFSIGLGIAKTGASAAKGTFKGLGTSLGDVKLGCIALAAAVWKLKDGLASCVKQSMDFVETMNLFNVSMGDNAFAAGEFAEKVQQAFGIDMAQWMRNQGVFQTLIEGFGVASEKADVMSQNLTQLGYDLSSLFNLPFAESMQKLQSGIAGELEPLRRLGYDLSQAKLQQIAYDHGIQQSISTMTQAEKSQLRYYAIMTQVTTAHGDMARTIMQPANMLRVFKENVVIAARSIGNLLIPVMQAFLSVAIVVARGIAKIANVIASLFGIKTDWRGYMDDLNYNGGGGIEDIADDIDDVGGAASGATKKVKEFKKQFLGFDKINNITLPTEPSSGGGRGGGGGATGGGDFDLPLPTYDFLQGIEDAFAKAHPKIQKLFDDLAADFKNGGNNIGRILGEALRDALLSIKWGEIKSIGRRIATKIADGLNDFFETPDLFKSIGFTLAQTLNTVITSANAFATSLHWDSVGRAIADSINAFFRTFDFAEFGSMLYHFASGLLEALITAVSNTDWILIGEKVVEFLSSIDWADLVHKAINLAGLIVTGIAEFTISFIANLAYKILKWLYEKITGNKDAELNLKLNGEETPEFNKAKSEYDETQDKRTTVNVNGKERKSWAKMQKDFNEVNDKTVTTTTKGETDRSFSKTEEEYGKVKDKKATANLYGDIKQSAKDTFSYQNKLKDRNVTTKLYGDPTSSIKNTYKWQASFKDQSFNTRLTGDPTSSLKNAYKWQVSFKNQNVQTNLIGNVTSSMETAWDWYDSFRTKNIDLWLNGHLDGPAEKIVATMGQFSQVMMPKAEGGIYKNGRWIPVTAAAGGGAFNTGQMFIAREAGPELVGTIGGHTAVMNNNQIVSSVAAGVASANSTQNALLQQLLSAVQGGSQEVALEIDGTRFGTLAIRSINRVQRQQGRVLLNV